MTILRAAALAAVSRDAGRTWGPVRTLEAEGRSFAYTSITWVGDGAVLDTQFNTTDVCVVVRTDLVTAKYYRHYERSVGGRESVE